MKNTTVSLMLLASLGLSLNPIVTKAIADEISFIGVLLIRFTLVVLFIPIITVALRENTLRSFFTLDRQFMWQFLALAFFFAGSSLLFYYSFDFIDVNRALFIYFTYPVVTVIFAHIFIKEGISRQEGAAIAISLMGALVIFAFGESGPNTLLGDLMVIVSMLLWAGYVVLNKYTALREIHYRQTFWIFLFASLLLAPIYFFFGEPQQVFSLSPKAAMLLLTIGIFSTLVPYAIINYMARHLKTSVIGLFILLANVFTVLLALAFLGEKTTPNVVFGGFLIGVAALLSVYQFDKLFSWKFYLRHRIQDNKLFSIVKKILTF